MPIESGLQMPAEYRLHEHYFTLDGARALPEMERLGHSLARIHLDQLQPIFFDVPAQTFKPLPVEAKDDEIS